MIITWLKNYYNITPESKHKVVKKLYKGWNARITFPETYKIRHKVLFARRYEEKNYESMIHIYLKEDGLLFKNFYNNNNNNDLYLKWDMIKSVFKTNYSTPTIHITCCDEYEFEFTTPIGWSNTIVNVLEEHINQKIRYSQIGY
jgi:hypothetical protein